MTKYTKAVTFILMAVLLFAVVLPFSVVLAEDTVAGFDASYILDDLNGAQILGKEFNIADYPLNENGTPELLAFTEFAFTYKMEYQKYYGLYLYIYYPQGGLQDSEKNKVQIAVSYDDNGEPSQYVKFELELLSRDSSEDTAVLYKFKVLSGELYGVTYTSADIYRRVALSSGERRYDISGVELFKLTEEQQTNAVEYGIGGTWKITGYDKGMHESSEEQSTLVSTATFQNTLKLDVHSTYYRSWRNLTDTLADQLSSVYFGVDNKIDNEYDQLYAIDFEAFKYLSSPIFCIYEKAGLFNGSLLVDYPQTYANLLNQRGKSKTEFDSLPGTQWTWLCWDLQDSDSGAIATQYYACPLAGATNDLDKLAWVFQTTNESDHEISTEQMLDYMWDFSTYFGRDVRATYSSLLFADHYYSWEMDYAKREFGVNIGRTIKASEEFNLIGSLSDHTYWQKLALSFGFAKEDTVSKFAPIQEVTYTEIKYLSDEEIAQNYFVHKNDVSEFKAYVQNQNAINKTVYLFRFDIDTFYTSELRSQNLGKCGYVCQEPIYLDFDVISLTYDKAGVKTVIPVVSNPIDIVAGIEPPGDGLDFELLFDNLMTRFITTVFGIIALVAFVLIAWSIVKYIFLKK